MRISKLTKIKAQRVFRDFAWPADLLPFAQYNVVYGWNGTGKTTLSSLFAHLQDRQNISEGEVEFEFDTNNRVLGSNLSAANIPPVRVFNRDFVSRTIESIGQGNVSPIYFLGEGSIEKQKEVVQLKARLEVATKSVTDAEDKKKKTAKGLDDFCIEKSKLIKDALLGSAQYANYDKRQFKNAVTRLKQQASLPVALSNEQKLAQRKQRDLKAKPSVSNLTLTVPNFEEIRSRTVELLNRSVVSQVIDALVSDVAVAKWVQQGLALHKGGSESNTCRFCGNEFTVNRRSELEGHFNDALANLQRDIEAAIRAIEEKRKSLANVVFPDEARLYDNLNSDFHKAVDEAKIAIQSVDTELGCLNDALERKKSAPFEKLTLAVAECLGGDHLSMAVGAVNTVIKRHEETTAQLADEVRKACESLEQDFVLEALQKFNELNGFISESETVATTVREEPERINQQIKAIEREIVEHRRPAEELNRELRAYLGRDELQFSIKDTGYALTRGDTPATHLSEGERTAIAFLYFLKSLEDKGFNRSTGIVVVDDPVSSLDANSLFSAFGYMKERTKDCHQLFILTHNFSFFRQIKNWFHHLTGKKGEKKPSRRFYALSTKSVGNERSAIIGAIDPLLEEFESEYHFLFRQVYDIATATTPAQNLPEFYGVPNISRRLLETFLAHRFPDCKGGLTMQFDRVEFDATKKTQVLRLLHTYSHSGGIVEPEHDPSVLCETGHVMKIILEIMESIDRVHYQGMVNSCRQQ